MLLWNFMLLCYFYRADTFTQKMQLTVGICAAKALVQHLCERFNNPDNVHVVILSV
jgi:hypothetical protein